VGAGSLKPQVPCFRTISVTHHKPAHPPFHLSFSLPHLSSNPLKLTHSTPGFEGRSPIHAFLHSITELKRRASTTSCFTILRFLPRPALLQEAGATSIAPNLPFISPTRRTSEAASAVVLTQSQHVFECACHHAASTIALSCPRNFSIRPRGPKQPASRVHCRSATS
jgi:hypothetical protein